MEVRRRLFDPSNLPWAVSQCPFDPYYAGVKVYRTYRTGGRPAPQTTLLPAVATTRRRYYPPPLLPAATRRYYPPLLTAAAIARRRRYCYRYRYCHYRRRRYYALPLPPLLLPKLTLPLSTP
jgi:hypothetical protein